jgi:hypothetical protein
VTTLAPRPLTADECTILAVVADAAAGQGRRDPLVSRTSVLRAADNRGLPKMAGRAAWYSLIESGAVVPVDDGEGDAFAPYPRPYVVARGPLWRLPRPRPTRGSQAVLGPLSGPAATCAASVCSPSPPSRPGTAGAAHATPPRWSAPASAGSDAGPSPARRRADTCPAATGPDHQVPAETPPSPGGTSRGRSPR